MLLPHRGTVDELDEVPTLDSCHLFGREALCMVIPEVRLQFIGASPLEITEWASMWGHVFVVYVSFELLGPSIIFFAFRTRMPPPIATRSTTFFLLFCDATSRYITSSSGDLGLCLRRKCALSYDSRKTLRFLPRGV
jgi:hypothetical protein